jgi:hypothetical protein
MLYERIVYDVKLIAGNTHPVIRHLSQLFIKPNVLCVSHHEVNFTNMFLC